MIRPPPRSTRTTHSFPTRRSSDLKVGNKPPEYFMKPLYVITRDNMAKYADQLSEGHKAMFKTYPDYKMVVYPTVRNAFFPDEIYKATIANATRASLNGTDDVQGAERSEEHTSELQSLMRISYAVFCLKKKNKTTIKNKTQQHQEKQQLHNQQATIRD